MRRAILIVAIGLAVFALAALAGFVTAARIAPERLQASAERRLSELTGAHVEIGTVHLTWSEQLPWIELRAIDARIVWEGGGSFEAEQLAAALNPLALTVGRLDLRDLQLEGARGVLPEWGDEAESNLSADIAWLAEQAAELRSDPCLGPEIEFRDLEIWQTIAGEVEPLLLAGHGELRCRVLGFQGEGHLEGTLRLAEGESAPMRIELRTTSGEAEMVLSAGEAPIPGWARTLHLETALSGRIGGTMRWRMPHGGPQFLDVNLRGHRVEGTIGSPEAPAVDLALERPRLRLNASGSPRKLEIRFAELEDRGVAISGDGVFSLPFQGQAPMRSRVSVSELSRDDTAHLLEQLPPAFDEVTDRTFARIEGGTLASLEVGLRTTFEGFRSIMGRGPLTRPGDLTVALEFRDAVLRAGAADRLSEVSGRMRFDGDRFEVSELTARFGERRLERIDAALVGLSHLKDPEDLRCDRPDHVEAMPGIDSFAQWRTSRRAPDAAPSWQRLRLELDRVDHPILLCGLSDVAAELVPDAHGLDATIEHAVWAGLPIEANATYRESGTGERVVLTATVGAPVRSGAEAEAAPAEDAAATPLASASHWVDGRFEIEATRLGSWRIRGASGEIDVRDTQLELRDVVLLLDPGGSIEGDAKIELGDAGDPFYEAALQIANVPLLDLWASAGLEGGLLSGHLHGAAAMSGRLHPNENPLAHASGAVTLNARSGEIHQRIPFVLAIAMAGSRFAPFQKRDLIPYDAIDLSGVLEAGQLDIKNMTLTAPDLRAAASGELDFGDEAEIAMVVGVFFFPRLDGLIQKIPILNRVFLGRNQNLVGAYFSVEGPVQSPSARVVPTESILQGGAGMVLALPAFVLGGIQQIQSMVIPRARPREREEDS